MTPHRYPKFPGLGEMLKRRARIASAPQDLQWNAKDPVTYPDMSISTEPSTKLIRSSLLYPKPALIRTRETRKTPILFETTRCEKRSVVFDMNSSI